MGWAESQSANPSPDNCPALDLVCEEESLAFHLTKKKCAFSGMWYLCMTFTLCYED